MKSGSNCGVGGVVSWREACFALSNHERNIVGINVCEAAPAMSGTNHLVVTLFRMLVSLLKYKERPVKTAGVPDGAAYPGCWCIEARVGEGLTNRELLGSLVMSTVRAWRLLY
jgi:hypothetical protein